MTRLDPEKLTIEVEMAKRRIPTFVAEKIDRNLSDEQLVELGRHFTRKQASEFREFLALLLNEEVTDFIIDIVAGWVPWGLGWVVKKALDAILPSKLLAVLFMLLDKVDEARDD